MEFFLQRMSESNKTKAILSIVLGAISLVMMLVAFHLNFQQKPFSASALQPVVTSEQEVRN